ncbi:hypothetical protein F5Y16DRAFT_85367 [Xylariaceae sp. FL0255]|nr:hypothetical protein F5Y16DRAFT_85367 [Xylariaceae sp. FL0255]
MPVFTPFPRLPVELRLQVWEDALAEELRERQDRLTLLLHTRSIYMAPMKHLASPFLSVSRETRECALKVYETRLMVFRMPTPKPDEDTYRDRFGLRRWNRFLRKLGMRESLCSSSSPGDTDEQYSGEEEDSPGYDEEGMDIMEAGADVMEHSDSDSELDLDFDLEKDFDLGDDANIAKDPSFDYDVFSTSTEKTIRNIENTGIRAGVVYVNLKSDRLVMCNEDTTQGTSILQPFWADAAAIMRDRRLPSETEQELSWQYVTQSFQPSTLSRIESVVLAEDRHRRDRWLPEAGAFIRLMNHSPWYEREFHPPHKYQLEIANHLWQTAIFTGLQVWDHLWFSDGLECFLEDLANKPANEHNIRRWSKYSDVDREFVGEDQATRDLANENGWLYRLFP